MKKPVRGAAVLTAVVCTGLVAASPVSAEQTGWSDPAGDMVDVDSGAVVPTHRNGDLLRVKVNHTEAALRVRLSFGELRKTGDCLQLSADLRTDRTRERGYDTGFYVNAGPRCDDPGTGTWAPWIEMDDYFAQGPTAVIDWTDNVVHVRIPRRVLGEPHWARVRINQALHATPHRWLVDGPDVGWTARLFPGTPPPAQE